MSCNNNIAILLCTYNGEKFVEDQLESFFNLKLSNLSLDIYISDDGSSDNTLDILIKFREKWNLGKFIIINGPRKGFAFNFWSLIANKNIHADYFMLCDQDDIWLSNRIQLFLSAIENHGNTPALYCAKTRYINSFGKSLLKYSKPIHRSLSFRNALVENIASGNTFVFNQSAKQLFERTVVKDLVYHDWLCLILVFASDGYVFYDQNISVLYRQHDNNMLGGGGSVDSLIKRFKGIIGGKYKRWNDINMTTLLNNKELISNRNLSFLCKFQAARNTPYPFNLYKLFKLRIYSQTGLRNTVMWASILLNLF